LPEPFTDLDTTTVDLACAAVFVAEFFVWWEQAGRHFYHDTDEGLKAFARDAVTALGGWRQARRLLRALDQTTRTLIEAKGVLL
jgi:hypothetical protein